MVSAVLLMSPSLCLLLTFLIIVDFPGKRTRNLKQPYCVCVYSMNILLMYMLIITISKFKRVVT